MTNHPYEPILEITRGGIVESIQYGAVAIVDAHGRLIARQGDAETVTFLRSSAKPFQALPFVERGGVEHFGLEPKELALICASHTGTDEHVSTIQSIQKKTGVHESDLQCGTHPVPDEPTHEEMIRGGKVPTSNRHNCSGKHSGMLAHALLRGLPMEGYINPGHQIQQDILRAFAEMCGMDPKAVVVGIDGCSVPTFAVPLRNAALAIARLCDPCELPVERAEACRKITSAMTGNPVMVAGYGRFDTHLMIAGKGMILSKAGAEGYQVFGLLPGALEKNSPGMGIAFKISDGDLGGHIRPTFAGMSSDSRARSVVGMAILKKLGALNAGQIAELKEFDARPIHNWKELKVGEYRPVINF